MYLAKPFRTAVTMVIVQSEVLFKGRDFANIFFIGNNLTSSKKKYRFCVKFTSKVTKHSEFL